MSEPDVRQIKCPKCGRIHPIFTTNIKDVNINEVCSICKANKGTREASEYTKSIFQRY